MAYGAILGQNPVPSGLISLWYGAVTNIPGGWVICDGQNGTPDLRDKFIVGAGNSYQVGNSGGNDSITLTANQLPSHFHGATGLSVNEAGTHTHDTFNYSYSSGTINSEGGGIVRSVMFYTGATGQTTSEAGEHTHTLSGTTATTGSNENIDIRPQYYALCYIMKL